MYTRQEAQTVKAAKTFVDGPRSLETNDVPPTMSAANAAATSCTAQTFYRGCEATTTAPEDRRPGTKLNFVGAKNWQ